MTTQPSRHHEAALLLPPCLHTLKPPNPRRPRAQRPCSHPATSPAHRHKVEQHVSIGEHETLVAAAAQRVQARALLIQDVVSQLALREQLAAARAKEREVGRALAHAHDEASAVAKARLVDGLLFSRLAVSRQYSHRRARLTHIVQQHRRVARGGEQHVLGRLTPRE